MQSAGLMAVHQTKLDRYALLAALAERQALDGLRSTAPIILPAAVSTHGEFCPGAVRLQEWLTGKYRARLLLEGDRDDGEKTEDLTAAFRREFRAPHDQCYQTATARNPAACAVARQLS